MIDKHNATMNMSNCRHVSLKNYVNQIAVFANVTSYEIFCIYTCRTVSTKKTENENYQLSLYNN